ncbi:MAG: DUF4318 domain-containing protein [Clostridium sp.]
MNKLSSTLFHIVHGYSYFKVQEKYSSLKTLMTLCLLVDLNELPKGKLEFLSAVENYCIKEKIEYEFIEKEFPGTIKMNNVIYDVGVVGDATGHGGICYSLIFYKVK